MKSLFDNNLTENIKVMNELIDIKDDIFNFYKMIEKTIKNENKILICGNGGSAADAQHFAAELMVKFEKKRSALPAIALTTDTSILTACGNDFTFDEIFSRQIEGLSKKNDLVIGISTSGKSKNVINALKKAKLKNSNTVILTGKNKINGNFIDHKIHVPSLKTSRIQEAHLFIYHIICSMLDEEFK